MINTAFTWLEYCRYGVKHKKINQSIMINKGLKTTQNNTETTAIIYNNFEVDTLSGIRTVHIH